MTTAVPKRVPSWLLNQLPMWECGKCGEPFPKDDNQTLICSKCGGERRPPSKATIENAVLKVFCGLAGIEFKPLVIEKERSEFAHEMLAPKLTIKQREALFQFFTEFFSDGFESGDFSAWTGTSGAGCSVETNNPHHETYNGKFTGSGSQYCYKTGLTDAAIAYHRAYYKFGTLPDEQDEMFGFCQIGNSGTNWCSATVKYQGGNIYFGLILYIDEAWSHYLESTPSNPSTGAYYCVEVLRDVTNGDCTLWVDDAEKKTVEVSNVGNNNRISDGITNDNYCNTDQTVYVDCVIDADAYIGPESTISIPVLMHHYQTMRKR